MICFRSFHQNRCLLAAVAQSVPYASLTVLSGLPNPSLSSLSCSSALYICSLRTRHHHHHRLRQAFCFCVQKNHEIVCHQNATDKRGLQETRPLWECSRH